MYELFECIFLHFEGENMYKCHKIKTDHRVIRKNQVDTNEAPVFATNYGATGLAAKM
jgi:hypothetical protein